MTTPRLSVIVLALGIAIALDSAQAGAVRQAPRLAPARRPEAVTANPQPEQARQLAEEFMEQMLAGDYPAQWQELAPLAQEQWPSQLARQQMLALKFGGAAKVAGFKLGPVRQGTSWTSPEDPRESVSGGYAIPVQLSFAHPQAMAPVGIASDYQSINLVVAESNLDLAPQLTRLGGPARGLRVVGEGPCSLDAPIIEPALPATQTAQVPVLMYHLVGPLPVRSSYSVGYSYELDYELTVPPAQFGQEIDYMVGQGYTAISLTKLMDHLEYGLPLPRRPVVLTFDDGFLNEYQYAVPLLRQVGYTGVFFPCSGLIGVTNGHEAYMTAGDLRWLGENGFWVEDHTYNDGTALWGRSQAEINQLAGATAAQLEAITDEPIQFIAYSGLWPYKSGTQVGPGEAKLFSELPPLGYVAGLEDDWLPGSPWQENSAQPWELGRLRAYPNEPLSAFASILRAG